MKIAYPAYLKKGFQPYDPIELMRLTEDKVCRGETRKYTDFYCVGVYGGISTGYLSLITTSWAVFGPISNRASNHDIVCCFA